MQDDHNQSNLLNACNCEMMEDSMIGRWDCPQHGLREPRYDLINQLIEERREEDGSQSM